MALPLRVLLQVGPRMFRFVWKGTMHKRKVELILRQNAEFRCHDCSAIEFHFPEVELLEKTATRADLADATPVPCAHVGMRDGVASTE